MSNFLRSSNLGRKCPDEVIHQGLFLSGPFLVIPRYSLTAVNYLGNGWHGEDWFQLAGQGSILPLGLTKPFFNSRGIPWEPQ